MHNNIITAGNSVVMNSDCTTVSVAENLPICKSEKDKPPLLESPSVIVVSHNIRNDMQMMRYICCSHYLWA